MNKVVLMGRLVRDVDFRVNGDSSVAKFSVAVDRRFKGKDGKTEADFISCVAFNKTAEFIEKYFHKGMKIAVSGRIQTGSYTNREGQKVYTTDVVCDEAEFVESKNASEPAPQTAPASDDGFANATDSDGFANIDDLELPFH